MSGGWIAVLIAERNGKAGEGIGSTKRSHTTSDRAAASTVSGPVGWVGLGSPSARARSSEAVVASWARPLGPRGPGAGEC